MIRQAALILAFLLPTLPAHGAPAHGKVSGAATYALTKEFLATAPRRTVGTSGHAAAERFIESHFAPEAAAHRLEVDTFTASTPAGLQTMHNILVRFPGKKDGTIVLGSHYETTTHCATSTSWGLTMGPVPLPC